MALPKFTPKKVLESTLPTTGVDGEVYITEKGNFYVATSSGSLMKITDVIPCNILPSSPMMGKVYLLSSDKSINIWDGIGWNKYGGSTYALPIATSTTLGGVKSGGNGINIDNVGMVSAKLGTGMTSDVSGNIIPDTANIDITQLKNYSMLSLGSPKGFFDSSATLATFADAQKGSFWIYSGTTSTTIGTVTFTTNDQLWCKTTFTGSPTDLSTNFVKVPYTLVQATTTSAGAVKLGSATPLMDSSTASVGTALAMSREDHVHPSDTKKVDKLSSSTVNGIVTFADATGGVLKDSTKTLPTGVLVGTTDTQTLSNKSLQDTTTTIINAVDTTKGLKTDVSGNTTGVIGTIKTQFSSAKTITIPDSSGVLTIAPNVVELNSVQNLNLVENTIYEITSTAVNGSVLTLPTSASATGSYIDFFVSCAGFSDTVNFIIRGSNINGTTNDVINNRSYVYFRFVYSKKLSVWILVNSNNGY